MPHVPSKSMLRDRFIPTEELARISEGSYEQLITKLMMEVSSSAEKLFGARGDLEWIGTFPNHAIVLHENGKAVRIRFEKDTKGNPKIVASEPYPLQNFAKSEAKDFLKQRADKTIAALFERNESKALTHIKEMLPLLQEEAPPNPVDVVELAISQLEADRPWKTSYTENQPRIHNLVGSELGAIDQNRLEAKFVKLYDGSMPVSERSGYSVLVSSDFVSLVERFERLAASVAPLMDSFTALSASPDTNKVALGGFGLDFSEDLKQTARVLRESESRIQDVAMKGRVYDVAAKALYRYDVAAKYVIGELGQSNNG